MRFTVRGLSAARRVEALDIDAADEGAARAAAVQQGYSVLSVHRQARLEGRSGRFPLLLFSQELLALLQSGLPLVESIDALTEKETRGGVRSVLDGLRTALREGRPLSAALEAQPHAFPDLYVSMIRAAERTSDLDASLERYIAYREQMDGLRGRIVSASVYPVMLLVIGGLVVLFLLGYVVPRFAGVFEEVGGDLPFLSRLLLRWGGLVEAHAAMLALAAGGAIAGAIVLLRHPAMRRMAGRAAWSIPAVGERLKVFQLARFYRTFGMLLRGGIPALTALGMSRELLSPALRVALDQAGVRIREGRSLADTLAEFGLTTPVASRMLRVGERAGNLGEMTERIARFHEEEIARWVDWVTRLIGPALMLLIGGVIGLIVVLMYLPIFQLAETLQ